MEALQKIRPVYSSDYLGNPHKGNCTFQHFNGDPLFEGLRWSEEGPLEFPIPKSFAPVDGYLPSTVSYCRWFWDVLEPQQGKYDFSMIDKSLQACSERGQTLAVRLMAFGSLTQPKVPTWYSSKYKMMSMLVHGQTLEHPDHDSPEYLEQWGNVIKEFAKRYDGHPLLESIDLAFIGPWGEGAGECSLERMREFSQLYRDVFKKTLRMCQIDGPQMAIGIETGTGWRADCFGDLRQRGTPDFPRHLSFNHHYDAYPQQVFFSGAAETWKTMPVHFETCGVPMGWFLEGYDIDFIIEQGYKFHATYFMPKSTRLPEKWMDKLSGFCRKLGYRFTIRHVLTNSSLTLGEDLRFHCWIENVGVAPIYFKYDLALRIRQGGKSFIVPFADIDIRKWLPGDFLMDRRFPLPSGLQRGSAELSLGLIDPETQQAKVNFANRERFSDRWTLLGTVEIK